ncbi:MAG: hypothetical protein ACREB7_12110 [Sphingopyxis sp.]|uniref:hypothetical protein n=1 Tax=Sphingopyxis sp. TaxID=1908224 RepID=UPI003D6D834B
MGKVHSSVGKVSKPGDRFTARRRLPLQDPKAIARHNRRVGEVLHAYNSAHASVFGVFTFLGMHVDYQHTLDVWHSSGTDKGQRNLLEVAVRHRLKGRKVVQKGILWALGALDELGTFRNDAVHTNMAWYYDEFVPGIGSKEATIKRLEQLPFDKHWRALRGDLIALANYLAVLAYDVLGDNKLPSCKRPRLQLARSRSAETQTRRRQAKKAARERQRQS